MLHEIVRDTTRKSVKHELIRVASQTISVVYSISESHYTSFSF